MKAYALISFDVPDDSAGNFHKVSSLAGNIVENYDILKIISKEEVTFDDCRFPYKLRDMLMISGIKNVADMERYTFQWFVRLFIRNGIEGRQRTAYLECIIKTLKILGLSLSQNGEDDLIELDDCNLSLRMQRKLNDAGYYYLQDIADSTQFRISKIKGIRHGNQQILEEKMKENGLWYVG